MTSKGTFAKFIQDYLFMIVLTVMFLGFSAFKASNNSLTNYWYELDESGNIGSPMNDADVCNSGSKLCAIGFNEDPGSSLPGHISQVTGDATIRYKSN